MGRPPPDFLCFDLNCWQALSVHDMADARVELDISIKLVNTGHSTNQVLNGAVNSFISTQGWRRFKLPVTLGAL